MLSEARGTEVTIESRLAALELAVARLAAIVEPGFALGGVATPIAAVLATLQAQRDSFGKFFALLDLGESLLKYSAAIAFAWAIQTAPSQNTPITDFFKQPPTLGKIAGKLREVFQQYSSNTDWPFGLILQAFQKPNGRQTPLARYLLDEFISIRNDERGHGAHQPMGYYEDLFEKNRVIVEDCVKASTFITTPLVFVHSVDHRENVFAYRVTRLMGVAPIAVPDPILSPLRVRKGSTCLWDEGSQLLALDDFVVYRYCATCNAEHVFFADRISGQKVFLHSYVGNHRLTADRLA